LAVLGGANGNEVVEKEKEPSPLKEGRVEETIERGESGGGVFPGQY